MEKIVAVAALAASLSFLQMGTGETWYIDGSVSASGDGATWQTAFQTIQQGIDASSDGDTVIVAPGTYFENIHFDGRNITLTSTDPLDPDVVATTVIDGGKAGPVVTFSGDENSSCMLSGLTITNGASEWEPGGIRGDCTRAIICNNVVAGNSGGSGGGLYHCNGVIWGNTITGNLADGDGGGLCRCSGEIRGNLITQNSCKRCGGGLGFCQGAIEDNVILDNSADRDGGGLYSCDQSVLRNQIRGNHARKYGGGLADCDGLIRQNTISENASGYSGGGLHQCDGLIERNWISGNSAGGCASWGWGLAYCDGTIRSNVICGHRSSSGGSVFYECSGRIRENTIVHNFPRGGGWSWIFSSCWADIANCIIWDNLTYQARTFYESRTPRNCCIQDWDGGGEGNIAEDPLFVNPEGEDRDADTYEDNDYRLSPESPCVDVGDSLSVDRPGLDMDGNFRIAFGKLSLTVDMGAYEYNASPFAVTGMRVLDGERLLLTWTSQPGDTYALRSCEDLLTGMWTQEGRSPIPSQGALTSCTVSFCTQRIKFFCIETSP